MFPSRRAQSGLTLVELVVFIVIIGVGLAGILGVLNFTLRNSANPMLVKQQIAIAESLLEEISSKAFTYCDPADPLVNTATSTAGCSIAQEMGPPASKYRHDQTNPFTHVADYNGLSMPIVAGGILNPGDGSPISGLGNYSARVAIIEVGNIAPTNVGVAGDVLRIDVTVSAPSQASITLTGYRYRYAPNSP